MQCRTGNTAELWRKTATVNKDGSKDKEFYRGQRVGGPPGVFRASRWLKGNWKRSHGEGTVSRVETTCVLVYWVASSSQLEAASAPANQQSLSDLTFFCPGKLLEEYTHWAAGDRCFFRRGAPAAASAGAQ